MFFFAKLLHAKPKHASGELSRKPREMRAYKASSQSLIVITTSWFAMALDEIRTTRILRQKADCKQSILHKTNFQNVSLQYNDK